MRDKVKPLLSSDSLFEVAQEGVSLLVRDLGHDVVRPLPLELKDQVRENAVAAAVRLDVVHEVLPADDRLQLHLLFAAQLADDVALDVDGPALIQPEVLPGVVRDEVAAVAVRELVGDDGDVLAVARDDGGAVEVEDGVLHAAQVERARQNDEVVEGPGVLEDEIL